MRFKGLESLGRQGECAHTRVLDCGLMVASPVNE